MSRPGVDYETIKHTAIKLLSQGIAISSLPKKSKKRQQLAKELIMQERKQEKVTNLVRE